jgi:hypothetical protein
MPFRGPGESPAALLLFGFEKFGMVLRRIPGKVSRSQFLQNLKVHSAIPSYHSVTRTLRHWNGDKEVAINIGFLPRRSIGVGHHCEISKTAVDIICGGRSSKASGLVSMFGGQPLKV